MNTYVRTHANKCSHVCSMYVRWIALCLLADTLKYTHTHKLISSIHPSIYPTVHEHNGNDENALVENNKRGTFCSCVRVEKYNTSHFMYRTWEIVKSTVRVSKRKRERERAYRNACRICFLGRSFFC